MFIPYRGRMSPCSVNKSTCPGLHLGYTVSFRAPVTAKPILRGGSLFAAGQDGTVLCLRSRNGKVKWQARITDPPATDGESALPYLHRGFVTGGVMDQTGWYIADVGGKAGDAFSNGRPGRLFRIDPANGKTVWETELTTDAFGGCREEPVQLEDRVIVPVSSYSGSIPGAPAPGGMLACYCKKSGNLLWQIHTPSLIPGSSAADTGCFPFGLCVGKGGRIFALLGHGSGLSAHTLICLDGETGNLIWYRASQGEHLLTGAPKCLYPTEIGTPEGCVAVGTAAGNLLCLDQCTGECLWECSTGCGSLSCPPALGAGKILVWGRPNSDGRTDGRDPSAAGIAADPKSGKILYRFSSEAPLASSLVCCANIFLAADMRGNVTCFDIDSGAMLCRTESCGSSIGSGPVTDGDRIFCGMGVPALLGGKGESFGLACFLPE